MPPTINRVSNIDIPLVHQILIKCGLDLQAKHGLTHWLPSIYPLENMLKDAEKFEVYALKFDENIVGTFTL